MRKPTQQGKDLTWLKYKTNQEDQRQVRKEEEMGDTKMRQLWRLDNRHLMLVVVPMTMLWAAWKTFTETIKAISEICRIILPRRDLEGNYRLEVRQSWIDVMIIWMCSSSTHCRKSQTRWSRLKVMQKVHMKHPVRARSTRLDRQTREYTKNALSRIEEYTQDMQWGRRF